MNKNNKNKIKSSIRNKSIFQNSLNIFPKLTVMVDTIANKQIYRFMNN